MSGRLLCLLLMLCSCDANPSVHVSGAVRNPGSYPFLASDTYTSLVATAGGITNEADTTLSFVIREIPDSTGRVATLHIPAKQLQKLGPGDTVHIPFRTYPVTLDSLVEVRDVDLTQAGRRYRLGHGHLLHGYVENKPHVAIILGQGIVETDGENAQSASFHYLYTRMDPTEFTARIKPYIVGSSTDPDAREDAQTIHTKLFPKAGDAAHDRALRTPRGYFKIFAGAYPRPRTPSNPGAGTRRRNYDDGRVWTTFDDGRQRTRHPDGKVVRLLLDGSERTEHTDGRVETSKPSGTQIIEYANGRKRTVYPNGSIVEQRNGLKITTYSIGTVSTVYPDGRRLNRFKSGLTETVYPNGRLQIVTETGDTIVRKPDGTERLRTKTGEEVITFPDGRRLQSSQRAPLIALGPEGGRRVRTYTGERLTIMPDGERRIVYADGVRRTIYPDGRDIIEGLNGVTTTYLENGTQKRTYKPDAGGERPPRLSLIEASGLRETIKPGERIGMNLTLGQIVTRIRVGVFALPRGRVLNIEPAYIDSHYATAHHIFNDPGLYRIQVLADIGNKVWQIAYDRIVTVGSGDVDLLVTTIRPTRSTETIAVLLFNRINNERSNLGIPGLRSDTSIDQVARERLWDIIDAQAMSGTSFSTGSAKEKMTLVGVSFDEVKEYTAKADLPEDAHIRLMLQDMRYRQTVLDSGWTHLGIAAEKSDSEYLIGVVFKK
jgi:hypothetical protein